MPVVIDRRISKRVVVFQNSVLNVDNPGVISFAIQGLTQNVRDIHIVTGADVNVTLVRGDHVFDVSTFAVDIDLIVIARDPLTTTEVD
ncbi:hypothetical protein [Roseovarius tolerans]|uniref:hypothetical protein n=1 Tax=Roseovarius tolerans TaxID=74031 RepID=UPI00067E725E|nr:hypothetical protein [Roseovarius tolerans]